MRQPRPEASIPVVPQAAPWRHRLAGLLLAAGTLLGGAVPAPALAAPPRGAAAQQPPAPTPPRGFAFALMGDMPYSTNEVKAVDALIDELNTDPELAFVLHVGDIKGGAERCDDGLLRERLQQLQRVSPPLVYTPGDNEWTDCHRPSNGSYVPTERLALLRRLAFPQPGRSLGQRPMAVRSQAREQPAHAAFVENVMFERQGVLVATLHVVGSRNDEVSWMGVDPKDGVSHLNPLREAENKARRSADLAWLDRVFDEATRIRAAGVVLAWHANPRFESAPGTLERQGFDPVLDKLRQRALAFDRPVLLLQGDDHVFQVDRPWMREGSSEPRVPKLTRVQTWGAPKVHWVKVHVAPGTPEVFQVEEQRVKANP
jgi:hypothetical protein